MLNIKNFKDRILLVKSFLGQVSTYGIGVILQRTISFFLIPIYIGYFSTEQFGAIALIDIIVGISEIIFGLGVPYAIIRYISLKNDQENEIITTGIAFSIFSGLIGTALLSLAVNPLNQIILKDVQYQTALQLAICIVPFAILLMIMESIWRIKQKAKLFTIFTVSKSLFTFLLIIVFIVHFKMGIIGIFIARLVVFGLMALIGLGILKSTLGKFDRSLLFKMIRYGAPLVPHKISLMINGIINRFILQYLLGLHAVGLYSMAAKVAQLVHQGLSPFLTAWAPFVFNQLDNEDKSNIKNVRSAGNIYIISILLFGAIVIIGGPVLIEFFDKAGNYHEAISLVKVIAIGVMFGSLYAVISFGIILKEKTYIIPIVSISAAIANVSLNFILIPILGISGAAWATLISNIIMAVLGYIISNKLFPMRFVWGLSIFFIGIMLLSIL
jgi:O-antigen/teichoic acid export membrane protein